MIFTTLLMKTYEKNKAVKKEVTPEHKLEVYGYYADRSVGATENISNSAKNFLTVFIDFGNCIINFYDFCQVENMKICLHSKIYIFNPIWARINSRIIIYF